MTKQSSCIINKAMMELSGAQNRPILDCNSPHTSNFVANGYLTLLLDSAKIKSDCISYLAAGESYDYKLAKITPVNSCEQLDN